MIIIRVSFKITRTVDNIQVNVQELYMILAKITRKIVISWYPRVEVLSKNNVRLAVNSDEKKTFFTAKRPHLLALNALKAVNFCKICGFSPHSAGSAENFFHRILLVVVKNFFSPHSAGSAEIFFHRILLAAVKNFLSPLKRWKKNWPLKYFLSPHSTHWAQILYFYSNSPQILHLLAIFSGDTSTRVCTGIKYMILVRLLEIIYDPCITFQKTYMNSR